MLPLVLIGPVAVGKSTVGSTLADLLCVPFVDLDEIAAPYYEQCGAPIEVLIEHAHADGFLAAHAWWQPARAHAAATAVADHPGSVIAFGAGHSHFEDEKFAAMIREVLAGATVVLLSAAPDEATAVKELRRRCVADRGEDQDWMIEGVDMLREWVTSEQNRRLADVTVVTADRSAAEVAAEILLSVG
ncbi:MAG: shikimate kinase [Ilumatobacteraceae bacterium]